MTMILTSWWQKGLFEIVRSIYPKQERRALSQRVHRKLRRNMHTEQQNQKHIENGRLRIKIRG